MPDFHCRIPVAKSSSLGSFSGRGENFRFWAILALFSFAPPNHNITRGWDSGLEHNLAIKTRALNERNRPNAAKDQTFDQAVWEIRERRVHMEVQPWVRASVENLEDLSQDTWPRCMVQTPYVRMSAGVDKPWRWRGSSSRVQVNTTTSYIDFPNAKVMRINERNHYDWDLLRHQATHLQKVFPATQMRLVSAVGFSISVLQPPIDKGLCTSIHW